MTPEQIAAVAAFKTAVDAFLAAMSTQPTPDPVPIPTPVLTIGALILDKTTLKAGETLSGRVTITGPGSVDRVIIALRAPGASHTAGPYTDMAPELAVTALPATLSASRAVPSAGRWEAYVAVQAAGKWIDGPSTFVTVTGTVPDPVPDPTPTPTPTGKMTLGAQGWFLGGGWTGNDVFASNVNWANAYSSGANIWAPQALAELKGYSTFRMMDWSNCNWSGISSWSQRRLVTDPGNATTYMDPQSNPLTPGMAYEWMIDFTNRGGVDLWLALPVKADDDYVKNLATLLKAKLDPSRRVYIEHSNEVWNGQFSQFGIANKAGTAAGVPGGNEFYKGIAWSLYRSLQMFQIFQDVFGAAAMGTRVMRVFSSSGNMDLSAQAFASVYRSSQWNPSGQKVDQFSSAPYPGGGSNGGASDAMTRFRSDVDRMCAGEPVKNLKATAAQYGIPAVGFYEMGGGYYSGADKFSKNPASYDAYLYMLNAFEKAGVNGMCCVYSLWGSWTDGSAWGNYSKVGQPLSEAHKARAMKDWVAARK